MKWINLACARWKDYRGRSGRKEFWYFYLFAVLVRVLLGLIANYFESSVGIAGSALLIFEIPLYVRRLHDTNKRWWWLLTIIPPFIFFFFKGDEGDNRFGEDPKKADDTSTKSLFKYFGLKNTK